MPLYWKPFAYESQDDFKVRIEQLPVMPVGVCKPVKQKYNMDKQLLPFQVSGFSFVQEIFDNTEIIISVDRQQAKQICQEMALWRIYGRVKINKNSCFTDIEFISDGKLQKTIKKQSVEEQYELGKEFYDSGNYKEAVLWYRKAAERGNAAAQNSLGDCYYNGEGVEQDYKEAVSWYRKAAEQGNVAAQSNLGHCYYNRKGVEQECEEALIKLLKQGYTGFLGLGLKEIEYNYKEAVKWYRKAAEQGDAAAQYSLGYCYDNGEGVEQDHKEAVKWYRKAAEQGDATAQKMLKEFKG